MDDWIAYLEAEPKSEPFLSIAAAWKADKARLAEVIAERDSIRTMLLNERTEWMDEAIRRQASVNQNLAALVTDAQEELRKCQQDAIQLQARLAEAEALRKDAERWRHEWQRECADTDLLLQGMGLCPSEYRSEGGSLLLGRISHKLKQRGGLS